MTRMLIIVFACVTLLITGCSGPRRQSGGGYYKDDGPGSSIPENIEAIPDAMPQIESHAPANRRPYVVFGKRYVPVSDERPFRQTGVASWYGRKFHGNKTANGETYDMHAMTAAHPTLPLPSYARVTSASSGKSVIVRINDRGPFHSSRIIDLSYVAAAKLNLIGPGSGQVIVEAITNNDIRKNAYQSQDQPAPEAISIPDARPAAAPPMLTAQAKPDPLAALMLDLAMPGYQVSALAEPKAADYAAGAPLIFLQYGAFSARENANRLVSSLNQKIRHIEHRRAEVISSAAVHRVHIGPYATRTQAVNAALRIQSETGRTATYIMQDANETAAPDRTRRSL